MNRVVIKRRLRLAGILLAIVAIAFLFSLVLVGLYGLSGYPTDKKRGRLTPPPFCLYQAGRLIPGAS